MTNIRLVFFNNRGYKNKYTFLNCSSFLEMLLIKIYYGLKTGT